MACCAPSAPVSRPALEVADIVRACAERYRDTHPLSPQQARALWAIENCRTAALGGHATMCDHCGAQELSFNSCRNRHCPKCQTLAQQRWVERQCADLLPVPYFHLVFTLPHALNPLAQGNPKLIYDLLFQAVSKTLLEFGRNPRWLGGEIGFTLVLHTWGQKLDQHLHIHAIVPGGALSPDGQHWRSASTGFLFPVAALSQVFRAKYLDALVAAYERRQLRFGGSTAALAEAGAFRLWVAKLRAQPWVVYAKRPFAGPAQLLRYLGRYTHRVAIANHRLLTFEEGIVRFRWRDYADGNKTKVMALSAEEFLRRFLLHTLPPGLCRIRHYGFLANRCRRQKLARCRALLNQPEPPPPEKESVDAMMLRLTGVDIHRCRHCHQGVLRFMAKLPPLRLPPKATGPPG